MAIGYISHHDCQLHDMGHHHPEQPARLSAINDRLIASGLEMILHQFDSVPVTRAQLEAVHDLAYIDSIYAAAPSEGLVWIDGDTAMNPHTLRAAELAAGADLQQAVHGVLGEQIHDVERVHAPLAFGVGNLTCLGCHDEENSPDFDLATYLPKVTH